MDIYLKYLVRSNATINRGTVLVALWSNKVDLRVL